MNTTAQINRKYFPYLILKVSSHCNLRCEYCHATNLPTKQKIMSKMLFSRILQEFIPYFAKRGCSKLRLLFHGGEPLLAGLTFFRDIVELESQVDTPNFPLFNTIQTNGTLITEDWIEIFKKGHFRIGLSVDGPEALHDKYRKYKGGKPTFNRIEQSIEMIREEKLPLALLSVVTEDSPCYYEEFFDLLMEWGVSSINFLPCVGSAAQKHIHAYSQFARKFFDLWLIKGTPFRVSIFLEILRNIRGKEGKLCTYTENCREYPTIDTLGRIYPCDRYIGDEKYRIGTISSSSFELADPPPLNLRKELPPACSGCEVSYICSGGCPAHIDPTTGRDIYCSARKNLIQHIYGRLQENDLSTEDIFQKYSRKARKAIRWVDTFTLLA